MNEKETLRASLIKLLEKHEILPYAKWENFEICHKKVKPNEEEMKLDYRKIRESAANNGGVYVYKKGLKEIYVGRGSKLLRRMKRHYQEAFSDSPRLNKTACDFFSSHTGNLTVYWKKCEDEITRRGYEGMLIFALKPSFEIFRESQKSVKKQQA